MGASRSQLALVYEQLCSRAKAISKQRNSAQISLFGDIIEEEKLDVVYPDVPEYELNEKLSKEKQVIGVYVSGHPFEKYMNTFPDCNFDCSAFEDYVEDEDGNRTYNRISDGMHITMAGIIANIRRTTTKRTGSSMAFVTLEDVYGSLDCVCFPAIYDKFKNQISADKIVKVKGKLDVDADNSVSLIVAEIVQVESEKVVTPSKTDKNPVLWLNAAKLDDDTFDEFVNMLYNYEGKIVCKIVRGDKKYLLPVGVNYCRGLLAEICSFIDLADVRYVDGN